ncbi:hypothetical protein KBC31_04285 [Candidatus Saccharibacteria bacterium]|nr:hypothetical protein [Candidatus Saccharibacteria bacterium]
MDNEGRIESDATLQPDLVLVKRKLKKVMIITASIVIIFFAIGYLAIASIFSGGIDGYIYNLKPVPNPKSPRVSASRSIVKKEIDHEFSQIEKASSLKRYAVSTYDNCYEGENNWKVKEGYAHRCDYQITRFYGFDKDFRHKMLEFEATITTLGWTTTNSDNSGISGIMADYYNPQHSEKNLQSINEFGREYLVSDLPNSTDYSKNEISMGMTFAERKTMEFQGLDRFDYIQEYSLAHIGPPFYEDKNLVDTKSTFSKITKDNKYVLVVLLNKNYFEN